MIPPAAMDKILRDVWDEGQKHGWPVSGSRLAKEGYFGSEEGQGKRALEQLKAECDQTRVLTITLAFDIQCFSKETRERIGVE